MLGLELARAADSRKDIRAAEDMAEADDMHQAEAAEAAESCLHEEDMDSLRAVGPA